MNYFYVMNYKKYQSICRTSSRFELGMKNYLNKTGSENQVESSGNSLIKVNMYFCGILIKFCSCITEFSGREMIILPMKRGYNSSYFLSPFHNCQLRTCPAEESISVPATHCPWNSNLFSDICSKNHLGSSPSRCTLCAA